MEIGVDDGKVVVKLVQEEEFLPSLVEALRESGVTSGLVLAGIGALKEIELGWFDPEKRSYVTRHFEDSHELVSLQGTVTLESDPPVHLHCALASDSQDVVGGHLFGGTVSVLAEVAISVLDGVHLSRELNPATGLKELRVKKV